MDEQRRLAIYNGIKANRTKTQQPKVPKETMFFLVARKLCEYYADPRAGKVSHRWLMNKILREFSKNLWGHYSMSDDEIITEAEMDARNDDDIANLPVLNAYMRTHRMTMDQCFEILCTNGRNIAQNVGTGGTAGQSSGPAPSAQPSDARASQQGPLTTAARPTDARASQSGPSRTSAKPADMGTSQQGPLTTTVQPTIARVSQQGLSRTSVPPTDARAFLQGLSGMPAHRRKTLAARSHVDLCSAPQGSSQLGAPSRETQPNPIGVSKLALVQPLSNSHNSPSGTKSQSGNSSNDDTELINDTYSSNFGSVTSFTYPLPRCIIYNEHIGPVAAQLSVLLGVKIDRTFVPHAVTIYLADDMVSAVLNAPARKLVAYENLYRAHSYFSQWFDTMHKTKQIPPLSRFIHNLRASATRQQIETCHKSAGPVATRIRSPDYYHSFVATVTEHLDANDPYVSKDGSKSDAEVDAEGGARPEPAAKRRKMSIERS